MLGYNRTIARAKINVLMNIGPGEGGGWKRKDKKGNLPNTFDEDCRLACFSKISQIWSEHFTGNYKQNQFE